MNFNYYQDTIMTDFSLIALLDVEVYKSGKEIKEAAQARLNAHNAATVVLPTELIPQLEVLSRNPKDDDRIRLTVQQLILLGM